MHFIELNNVCFNWGSGGGVGEYECVCVCYDSSDSAGVTVLYIDKDERKQRRQPLLASI